MRSIMFLSAVAAAAAFSPVALRRPVLASPMRATCTAQPAQLPRLATLPRMAEAAAAPEVTATLCFHAAPSVPSRALTLFHLRACHTPSAHPLCIAVHRCASLCLPPSHTPHPLLCTVCTQEDGIMETLKTGSFFALWYLFNIGYNIYNKKALNALALPYSMATLQLAVGIPYVMLLWLTGLRKAPKMSVDNVKTLIPVSLGHLGTHIGAVVSLGAGAVSFTHIVKASEPVVSAALSAVMLGAFYHPITYLTLVPIVGGVALASLKELSFTWLGFIAAMVSNLSSALRGILAKKTMGGGVGENMSEARATSP